MESPKISNEDLMLYLPHNVLQDALGLPLGVRNSPVAAQLPSPSQMTSPQIPPLESRLHGYILGSQPGKQPNYQLNLANLFNALDLESEV